MNCPYCNKKAEYIDSKHYYSNSKSYGMMYLCRPCDAYVGTHKNSGKPLGTMANKELRELRKKCHAMFDPIWKSGMTRKEAYKLLEENTGVKHIAWTTVNECKSILAWIQETTNAKFNGQHIFP